MQSLPTLRASQKKQKPMWKDNQTGATYTQAEYEDMKGKYIYGRLVSRLVQQASAPDPVDALPEPAKRKGKMNENRIFDSADSEVDGQKA